VQVSRKSCSQAAPSRDFSQAPWIVRPSAAMVPLNRCEKPGAVRHSFQTPSFRLIW
jgi:hypothetical protein